MCIVGFSGREEWPTLELSFEEEMKYLRGYGPNNVDGWKGI
jgi:hypothetical protein